MDVAPALGEKLGVRQPAEVDAAGVAATLICAGVVGKVSVRLTPVTGDELELVIAIDSVEVPPLLIDTGEKDLVMLKGDEIMAKRACVEKSEL